VCTWGSIFFFFFFFLFLLFFAVVSRGCSLVSSVTAGFSLFTFSDSTQRRFGMSSKQILFVKPGVNFAKRNTMMFARWGAFAGLATLYLIEWATFFFL
jgi:hypothetical protein